MIINIQVEIILESILVAFPSLNNRNNNNPPTYTHPYKSTEKTAQIYAFAFINRQLILPDY